MKRQRLGHYSSKRNSLGLHHSIPNNSYVRLHKVPYAHITQGRYGTKTNQASHSLRKSYSTTHNSPHPHNTTHILHKFKGIIQALL